jgi:hypothetical protein
VHDAIARVAFSVPGKVLRFPLQNSSLLPFSRLADRILGASRADREDVKRDLGGTLAIGDLIGADSWTVRNPRAACT